MLIEYNIDNVHTLLRNPPRIRNPIRSPYPFSFFSLNPLSLTQSQTNYLSHFLLTHFLLPTLLSTLLPAILWHQQKRWRIAWLFRWPLS